MTIVSYNIHMGISPFRRRNVLEAIEVVIRETDADILCLQEDLQVDDLSETEIASRCRSVWGNTAFGQTVVHPRGVQGNSIISKFPIVDTESVKLPSLNGQSRSLLRGTIEVAPLGEIEVICAHFGLTEKQRYAQSESTLKYIEDRKLDGGPLFLAGDFNDWRGNVAKHLNKSGGLLEAFPAKSSSHFRTYPAWLPIFSLDRIFYKNCTLQDASVFSKSGRIGKSDHLPIVAHFKVF